jgi:type I restriction enzyme M protein
MARQRRTRAESRARYYIRREAERRGWDLRHVGRGGDTLEENEIAAHFPDIGLGLERPDFLFCMNGEPAVVVEAKNEAGKQTQALLEAVAYAQEINRAGGHRVRIAVGAAGEEDAGFVVAVAFLAAPGWVPLRSYGHELTAFPSAREVELGLAAGDGTTTVTVPAESDFIDAAVELSRILRSAKVEAPLRPKVIGAIVVAMYEGGVDTAKDRALASVNRLAEQGIAQAGDLPDVTKALLIETLRLTTADFDRLAPSIGRVVAILRRLNVRSVLQTDTDFLGMFYEAFLRYGYDNNALGIVFTPRHITRFCVELVGAQPRDRVIDVASGTGGFLVAAFDRMMGMVKSAASAQKVRESIWGVEINPTVWALSLLNMFFRGDGKGNMRRADCFAPDIRGQIEGRFTRAFLNPPFSQEGEPEIDFVDAAMEALEPEGLCAAVVYAGVFADDQHRSWREGFLRRHTLLGVVSLPEDLFYPTAAPTSILLARAHIPHGSESRAFMARVWNDGYEKLKNRRVERVGSQLQKVAVSFQRHLAGNAFRSQLATLVPAGALAEGAEWSPQQYLPQPPAQNDELATLQTVALRAVYQAVAQFPDLADEALEDLTGPWRSLQDLPVGVELAVEDFFQVWNGRSMGEKNYADGVSPYVSSGDTNNSIIRLVSVPEDELFQGGISVTAFGAASLQPWSFAGRGNGGSSVRVLEPRFDLSIRELLWFVGQINLQRWRFLYARMAIKGRLSRLVVKAPPQRLPDDGRSLAADLRAFRDRLEELSRIRSMP